MRLIQFDEGSGDRIGNAVRHVEDQANRRKPLNFSPVETPRSKGIALAKASTPGMPGETVVVNICTGTAGIEVVSATTATAFIRHFSLTPQEFVSIAQVDGDREVIGGGWQTRYFIGLTSQWQQDWPRAVQFAGGGTALVRNKFASFETTTAGIFVCSYTPDDSGYAYWQLVSAPQKATPAVKRATFTGEWASGATKNIDFVGGGTATALNPYEAISQAATATASCSVGWDGGAWHVIEKQRQRASVFRVGTFSASWSKSTQKTVTFTNQQETPTTALVTNLFANVTATGTRNCAVAQDGTAWYLVAAEC